MNNFCLIATASILFFSCEKNKINGVWMHKKNGEQTCLKINHYQYILKKETLPELDMIMYKEGKIVYLDDSLQFVPAKVFDVNVQKWLPDYDMFRPVYYVQRCTDTLILTNETDTVVYYRQTSK